ncbi:MAG: DUF5662 family protein [Gammaproteobacteria bacterium]|nr:DUF5662 family protein [Gammaproteobacteria bacterium]
MSDYDSTLDTQTHIQEVQDALGVIMAELGTRAMVHDKSKLEEPEKSIFDEVTPRLRALTYGSPEYKASLVDMGDALTHHYAKNSHHPEHYNTGIQGMDLLDVVEMFCDWCAATQRHKDGNILRSITQNEKRFSTGPVLASIFRNTAIRYGLGKKDIEVPR